MQIQLTGLEDRVVRESASVDECHIAAMTSYHKLGTIKQ